MDHGGMDHGNMDHAGQCSMNMLFTWDTTNLCVVFKWWHIRSTSHLLFSLVLIIFLAAGYDGLRSLSRRFERWAASSQTDVRRRNRFVVTGQRVQIIKALLYAIQNFYAFMLMLVFMTYNGWVMIAVTVGAFMGYLVFGEGSSVAKESMCH